MLVTRSLVCALVALLATSGAQTPSADAREAFATTFYQFGDTPPDDPDPTLAGVIKINLETGVATPFIPEVSGQLQFFTDVAVGPHDGLVYVSSLVGAISRFDATSGAFVDTFDFFAGSGNGNAVNTLRFTSDGTLYAAVSSNDSGLGTIVQYDPSGVRGPDVASGLTFPSGIALDAAGAVYLATGDVGGPGVVSRVDPAGLTPIVTGGAIGGGSGVTFIPAAGDYDADFDVDNDDYTVWQNGFAGAGPADGNADGTVDAADYTVWRDSVGAVSKLVITDFDFNSDFMGGVTGLGNELYEYNLATGVGGRLAEIPVPLPDPLPVAPPFAWPTNFPSEALLTPEGTLLVSTLGPTQRPLNSGALVEFDLEGNVLQTIATNLPPLSGIALVPDSLPTPVPEPAALIGLVAMIALARGRR